MENPFSETRSHTRAGAGPSVFLIFLRWAVAAFLRRALALLDAFSTSSSARNASACQRQGAREGVARLGVGCLLSHSRRENEQPGLTLPPNNPEHYYFVVRLNRAMRAAAEIY